MGASCESSCRSTFCSIAVPAKEVAVAGKNLGEAAIDDPLALFLEYRAEGWERLGWFPSPVGVISEFVPTRGRKANGDDGVFPSDPTGNQIYVTDRFFGIGDLPGLTHRTRDLSDFMLKPETSQVRANLEYSQAAIRQAIQSIRAKGSAHFIAKAPEDFRKAHSSWVNLFETFYGRYIDHLTTSLDAVNSKLARLNELERARSDICPLERLSGARGRSSVPPLGVRACCKF